MVPAPRDVRKFGFTILLTLAFFGCSDEPMPPIAPVATGPSAPGSSLLVSIWGFVADNRGVCIADAKVEILRGPGLGRAVTQVTPCSVWDYDRGFVLKDLTQGVEITLRASAPGYHAREATVMVFHRSQALEIILSKLE